VADEPQTTGLAHAQTLRTSLATAQKQSLAQKQGMMYQVKKLWISGDQSASPYTQRSATLSGHLVAGDYAGLQARQEPLRLRGGAQ